MQARNVIDRKIENLLCGGMIILDEETHFLAKGKTRSCYFHPSDSGKCIKVFFTEEDEKRVAGKEIKELRRLARKKLIGLEVPKYYGTEQTNLGKGYIFDLITDGGRNAPSLTLQQYITEHLEEAEQVMQSLLDVLIKNAPVIYGLNLDNFLIKKQPDGSQGFAIIDGFGEGTFLPMQSLFKYFARKKILKKYPKLLREAQAYVKKQKNDIDESAQ